MAHTTFPHGPHAHPVLDRLAENWWLLLARGVIAILLGLLAFASPGSALLGVVFLFGVYAMADGLLSFIAAFSHRDTGMPTWWLAAMGVIGILIGLAAFAWPGITAFVLVRVIAFWAILMGVVEIVGAIELRKEIDNEWMLIAGGVASVLFGLLLLLNPGTGTLALLWVLGFYALFIGASWIGLSLRLRRLTNE